MSRTSVRLRGRCRGISPPTSQEGLQAVAPWKYEPTDKAYPHHKYRESQTDRSVVCNHSSNQEELETEGEHQREHRIEQEPSRDHHKSFTHGLGIRLSMIGCRRHQCRYRNYHEAHRDEMHLTLDRAKSLVKSGIEDHYQLKSKQRLNARQNRSAFFQ